MRRRNLKGLGQALISTLAAGIILFAGWGYTHETRAAKAYTPNNLLRQSQEAIPADRPISASSDGIVRLHVRGNSNDEADQEVKLEVRDALMAGFGDALSEAETPEEAEALLKTSISDIERVAIQCLRDNGFSYGAKATVDVDYFPDRQYETAANGTVYLPAGEYKALIVNLGKGEGDNWWCVMYPPLCYFDMIQRSVARAGGGDVAAVRQLSLLIDELSTSDVPVEARSLLFDSISSGLKKFAGFIARITAGESSASSDR